MSEQKENFINHWQNRNPEDLPNEIWKDIEGWEGYYQISNLGRVKSIERKVKFLSCKEKPSKLKVDKSILRQWLGHGYPQISLYKDCKGKNYSTHRLLAKAFISNPENKPHINHKDGIRHHLEISNLEWCTPKENHIHKYEVLGYVSKGRKGKLSSCSKKVGQYDLSGNLIKIWDSQGEIERELGFEQANISACCRGKQRTSCGFKWKILC